MFWSCLTLAIYWPVIFTKDTKNPSLKTFQQLQTSCSHFTPDEDPGAAGLCPSLPSGGSFYGPTPVYISTWHWSGWCHHLPPGQITFSSVEAWKHCEDHVLWFLQCSQHHTACTFGEQAGACGGEPTPHILDPWLPHHSATVCEELGLCVGYSCLQYGAPQQTVLAPFLFTLYTADFSYQLPHSHLQKFSDDSVIVDLIGDGGDKAYRELIKDFVDWCQQNHLQLNAEKTKEPVVDFHRQSHRWTSREWTLWWWYLIITWEFTWTINWTGLITQHRTKGQSRLHLLRKLRSFGVQWALLTPFYKSVGASAIFYGVVCWSSSNSAAGRRRLDKRIKKASSILGCPLDLVQVVGESRMMDKLSLLLVKESHPCRSLSQHWALLVNTKSHLPMEGLSRKQETQVSKKLFYLFSLYYI